MKQKLLFRCGVLLCLFIVSACGRSYYHIPEPYPGRTQTNQHTYDSNTVIETTPKPNSGSVNSVVRDLSYKAQDQMRRGEQNAAAQTLERGLRIAPKEAQLWSQLADVRLHQRRFSQARQLATKSNSLAGGDMRLIEKNRRIIESTQGK